MTNLEWVKNLPIEKLAQFLINMTYDCCIDYDWDDEPYDSYITIWESPDGVGFLAEKDAIEHTKNWLMMEHGENNE